MRNLYLVPFLLLVCCVTEDNYVDKIGKIWCDRQEECNRADFEREFRDMEDCRDEFYDRWEPVQSCAIDAGCDYDPDAVADCRQKLSTQTCEDFDDGDWTEQCNDTYICSNSESLEVLGCLLRGDG